MIHHKQREAFDDTSRFKYLLTGRRGGKTVLLREDICRHVPIMPPKSRIYYVGPTNSDAYDLIWDDLEERFDNLGWHYRSQVSRRRFAFSNKRYVYVIGADKLRIRGKKVYRVYLDELREWEKPLSDAWNKDIRPSLADLQGGAVVASLKGLLGQAAAEGVGANPLCLGVLKVLLLSAVDPPELIRRTSGPSG